MKQTRERSTRKRRPASTPEARINQITSDAWDLLEERIRNGTATSQETTTVVKLGSEKAKLELEILRAQKELMEAKTEMIKATKRSDEMLLEAMEAMRHYSGNYDEQSEDPNLQRAY